VEGELEELAAALEAALDAGRALAGGPPLGVRRTVPADGQILYLAALADGAFVCLDDALAPATSVRTVVHAAGCVLLVERAEDLLDVSQLDVLADAAERLARRPPPPLEPAGLDEIAASARALRGWRDDPRRVVASLPALDAGVALHERLRGAYERFRALSEPLVEAQDELDEETLALLADVDRGAGAVGANRSLAAALAEMMPAVHAGAREIAERHLTPLDAPPA
jgi:hypothetical protein